MLGQGRIADAQKTADQALTLSRQSGNRQARFDAGLASARAFSAEGKGADGLKMLEGVLAEAKNTAISTTSTRLDLRWAKSKLR